MGKVIAIEHLTLDGVMQAPGHFHAVGSMGARLVWPHPSKAP
jgi:hypothetical protein